MFSEQALLQQAHTLQGLTFASLARAVERKLPAHILRGKGWVGSALEVYLGASAGNQAKPDFEALGIELKTLPMGKNGSVTESTFVTHIPLLTIHQETFETSTCLAKLRRVLWVPVEGEKAIPYAERRIGQPFLWSPDSETLAVMKQDWLMLTQVISTGRLQEVSAHLGEILQVRPKAANAKALCDYYDEMGQRQKTLPRGFYLRAGFTQSVIARPR